MRHRLLSLTAVFSSVLLGSPANAADAQIKVLLVTGQNNHKWEITTPVLRDALESSDAFAVTVTISPAKGADSAAWNSWNPDFADYDVVVSNYNG